MELADCHVRCWLEGIRSVLSASQNGYATQANCGENYLLSVNGGN